MQTLTTANSQFPHEDSLHTEAAASQPAIGGYRLADRHLHRPREGGQRGRLGVVIPVHNEAPNLEPLWRRLSRAADEANVLLSVLFVDDGSEDDSLRTIESIATRDSRVGYVSLSRRFGKEAAVSAGLNQIDCDALVFIDADLQDPPEAIPAMVEAWRAGAEVVFMRRRRGAGASGYRNLGSRLFGWLIDRLSSVRMPRDTGEYCLFGSAALLALRALPERNRYMRGLFAWVGFDPVCIEYDRAPRSRGRSAWSIFRLVGLALDGLTAFSTAPLRIASAIGAIVSLFALGGGLLIAARTLFFGDPVPGFPTLIVAMSLLGAVQLLSLGILGEYIGRIAIETKRRPLYVIRQQRLPQPAALEESGQ